MSKKPKEQDQFDASAVLNAARRARALDIQARLAVGEKISKNDIVFLEDYATEQAGGAVGAEDWAANKQALVTAIGISRKTLDRYWDADPSIKPSVKNGGQRANGQHSISAWIKYLHEVMDRPENSNIPPSVGLNGEEKHSGGGNYKQRQQKADALTSERKYAILEKEYIHGEKARQDVLSCNEKVRAELLRLFLQTAPAEYALVAGDPVKCREINERIINEALENLHQGIWS